MNSYPIELLTQLAPVMFVAGLDLPMSSSTGSSDTTTQPQPSPSRPQDPFLQLTQRLRDALVSQRKLSIWQPEKSKTFQVILVDKDVRFPPRKLLNPEDPGYASSHSPLSPLTPSSPLHPDGLIAPIWVRKHTTLVPSVFVLFKRLFEFQITTHQPRSPLDLPDTEREREREQEERKWDSQLAAEVALRKRSTNERGMKLTVVLLASRKMLDDPSLDTRLTFIRRQSGLDSRAALFVLSPVSQAELGEFISSLQQALYDPAVEYYTSHSKRVRRKRNRHSQSASAYSNPPALAPLGSGGATGPSRPLRPEGWTVRYEYKMACFAEFRGEDEVALKHYQDAYEALIIMFGSIIILPPRTKRWAEAKVLADCISIKITKLYLYNNEHALAVSHHTTHMRRFGDFSRGWGIGEETYEYWSWMARQHRVLAELIELGTHLPSNSTSTQTLVIPVHNPILSSASTTGIQRAGSPGIEIDANGIRSLGINPNHLLQHPGFYYYMAAKCTEIRRERFNAALLALEEHQHHPENPNPASNAPGFANEKKVDHFVLILELYTKSYEHFKKYAEVQAQATQTTQTQQGRLPLYIAYRIAHTYQDTEKYDMAIRFFERIAKTYRRDQWGYLLGPLLSTWYTCAKRLGDVELCVRLLVEMLGQGVDDPESENPEDVESQIMSMLKVSIPYHIVIDHIESQPLFDTSLVFWKPEAEVNEPVAFQIFLAAPTDRSIQSLPFSKLEIFTKEDDDSPFVVEHEGGDEGDLIRRADLGEIGTGRTEAATTKACLKWKKSGILILTGTMFSRAPTSLTLSHLKLHLSYESWKIEFPLKPCQSRQSSNTLGPRWLSSLDPVRFIPINREWYSSVNVKHRPHKVAVSVTHRQPAYLNENYPITVQITNVDDRELDVVVEVLLLPSDLDYAVNTIMADEEKSSGLLKGISLGVLSPGVSAVKALHLHSTGAAGDRTLDISVQSRSTSITTDSGDDVAVTQPELLDITETLRTVVVPTVEPLQMTCDVTYRRTLHPRKGLADLETFENDFWDDGDGGEATVVTTFRCSEPWGLAIESLVLKRQDGIHAKILTSSIDELGKDIFPSEYLPGDELGDICCISISSQGETVLQPIPLPGEYEVAWRRILSENDYGESTITTFVLPPLQPPIDGLIALLDPPTVAKLHQPIAMSLRIRNHHPTRSANVTVHLDPDPLDGFIMTGLRNGRVPVLLPGGEEKLTWKLVPVECGYVQLPKIRVVDRRKAIASAQGLGGPGTDVELEGVPVKIVDVRTEQKVLSIITTGEAAEGNDEKFVNLSKIADVLVLP
ncbi:hypothetical protein L218DRAFT_852654 [Marasmius fiardii PR-910]|nr:hypothetical protein L218DRAFT_852654 [Marasmius fiardii PR-910]